MSEFLFGLQEYFSTGTSLISLFFGCMLAATLIPISSEVFLYAVLKIHPEQQWIAVAVATAGNVTGGIINYFMGRLIPHKKEFKHEAQLRRYGPSALLASWIPIIGDPMCVAAGWLRLNFALCLLWMTVGKGTRYVIMGLFF
jgi:membrane protein YqaA with SNARE-associated domain